MGQRKRLLKKRQRQLGNHPLLRLAERFEPELAPDGMGGADPSRASKCQRLSLGLIELFQADQRIKALFVGRKWITRIGRGASDLKGFIEIGDRLLVQLCEDNPVAKSVKSSDLGAGVMCRCGGGKSAANVLASCRQVTLIVGRQAELSQGAILPFRRCRVHVPMPALVPSHSASRRN